VWGRKTALLPAAQGFACRQCFCGWLGGRTIASSWLGKKGTACRKRSRKEGHVEQLPGNGAIGVGGFHSITPLKSASTFAAVDEL
jgi:hypothetical protein